MLMCYKLQFSFYSDWSDWKGDLPPAVCLFCDESYPFTNQALQHMKVHLRANTVDTTLRWTWPAYVVLANVNLFVCN